MLPSSSDSASERFWAAYMVRYLGRKGHTAIAPIRASRPRPAPSCISGVPGLRVRRRRRQKRPPGQSHRRARRRQPLPPPPGLPKRRMSSSRPPKPRRSATVCTRSPKGHRGSERRAAQGDQRVLVLALGFCPLAGPHGQSAYLGRGSPHSEQHRQATHLIWQRGLTNQPHPRPLTVGELEKPSNEASCASRAPEFCCKP
jgi:hypothetical protein